MITFSQDMQWVWHVVEGIGVVLMLLFIGSIYIIAKHWRHL